jgi:DnaJ-class molecular chaperone
MEIATAYEILSSEELRKAYDDVSRSRIAASAVWFRAS